MNAAQIQIELDDLSCKINVLDLNIKDLKKEIDAARRDVGTAMLDGTGSTDKLEERLLSKESRLKNLEAAKTIARERLTEATKKLTTAKRADAEARMRELGSIAERSHKETLKLLRAAKEPATTMQAVLLEASALNASDGISTAPLGGLFSLLNPFDPHSCDAKVGLLVEYLEGFR